MRILHISDTHGSHRRLKHLPQADVVVHSGDFTLAGDEKEALDFMNWFCDLPYSHKIFICGNHDDCMYGADIDGLDDNVHYLCNSGVLIDGVKFYGVPMFMADCVYGRQNHYYELIPDDTDVLITHSPAFGILDFDDNVNYGSRDLQSRMASLKNIRAHLFGHIHARHGVVDDAGVIYSNGAIMNNEYNGTYSPNLILL